MWFPFGCLAVTPNCYFREVTSFQRPEASCVTSKIGQARRLISSCYRQRFLRLGREILPRIDKLIALELVLPIVQLLVAPAGGQQFFVRASFDNLTMLQHQDLIGRCELWKAGVR